jgi:hypothetical protein
MMPKGASARSGSTTSGRHAKAQVDTISSRKGKDLSDACSDEEEVDQDGNQEENEKEDLKEEKGKKLAKKKGGRSEKAYTSVAGMDAEIRRLKPVRGSWIETNSFANMICRTKVRTQRTFAKVWCLLNC